MKRYLFLLFVAFYCLPSIAQTVPYIGQSKSEFRKELRSYQSAIKRNAQYNAANKRAEAEKAEQNQAYLDSKPSAEITVDEATGITTITWGDGAMYRGQTYYGEIKGVGTMVYPDGSKYCGQWERDLPNGYGTMLYPDGLAYSANFVNGLPHGKGVVEDADGNKFSARWVYGKLKEKSLKPYKEKK